MRRDGGKGDRKRPLTVPKEQFESNWDAIFDKKKPEEKAQFKMQTYGFDSEKGGFFVEEVE